ncbi:MAG: SdpI family protein [Owenweeksia sp.]|nr:SdpI family protein [Owenweeksia sp.]
MGLVLLLAGFIFWRFPPTDVNMFFGYRTPRSTRSNQAWHYSQRLAAQWMLRIATFMLLAGGVFLFIDVSSWSAWLTFGVIMGFIVVGFGVLFYAVEKTLRQKFE